MKTLLAFVALMTACSLGCAVPERTHVGQPMSFSTERPLTLRVDAGSMWAGAGPMLEVHRAWNMPARGPVEGVSVVALPQRDGYVVSFEQGGAMWRGELDADRRPRGSLQMVVTPADRAPDGSAVASR
jgi:hypothetical protein